VVISDYSGGTLHARFTSNGASLLLVGVQGTRMEVGQLDLATGALETLLADTMLAYSFTAGLSLSANADGTRLATVLTEADQPPAVYAWALGVAPRQVSARSAHLVDVSWGRAETVEWTAPDGLRIEGVLIYPANYEEGKRYPLIAQIHGGPTGFWLRHFLAGWHDWAQLLAANGYAVLLPNPRGSAGRGREFAWRNQRDWGYGDFPDVLSGVETLIARGVADPDRLGIGGWSYGGYMTSWAIGHTDQFKAAIVGAGVTDLLSFQAADIPSWLPNSMMLAQPYDDQAVYLRSSPISAAANMKTPTLILHGASDERVRLGQGKELYHALRARGVETEMVIYPREPHIFQERAHQRDLLTRVLAWYDRWLKE
jgi:dipeptidyl aminopeptidase/acylaminoacyl peptidase